MAKKNRGLSIFLILLVLFIVGVVYFANIPFFKQEFGGGGDILGISNIDVSSSIPGIEGKAYLINVVANKGGQKLGVTITPETFKEFGIPDNEIPTGEFKLEVSLLENSCDYQILDDKFTPSIIYQASVRRGLNTAQCGNVVGKKLDADYTDYQDTGTGGATCPYNEINLNTVKANCKGEWAINETWVQQASPSLPFACVNPFEPFGTEKPLIGAAPDLGVGICDSLIDLQLAPQFNPDQSEWCYSVPHETCCGSYQDYLHWNVIHLGQYPLYQGFKIDTASFTKFRVNVTLTNDEGVQYSTEINTDQQAAEIFGLMKVKWVGSLSALQSCPVPAIDTAIVKNLQTNNFKEADKNDYDGVKDNNFELVNLDNNFYKTSSTDPGVGFSDITSRVSSNNARMNAIFTEGDLNENCYIVPETLQYRCEPQNDVIYPELQIIIKSNIVENLTVEIPAGDPVIENVTVPDETFEGDISKLAFSITNIGKDDDTFNVYAECGNPDIDVTSKKIPVGAGQTVQGFLEVNAPVGTFDCLVIAQSLNSLESDEEEVEVVFEQKPLTFEKPLPIPEQPEELYDTGLSFGAKVALWILGIIIFFIIIGVIFKKKIFKRKN